MNNKKIIALKKHIKNKNCKILSFCNLQQKIANDKIDTLIMLAHEKSKDYIKQQNYRDAEILVEQALKVKKDFRLQQYLVIIKMYLRKYEEAMILCKENIKKHKLAEDYNNLSLILRARNDYKNALKFGQKAVQKRPDSSPILANYAITAAACDKLDLALEYASKSIDIDPKNAMMYANKGSMYAQMNNMLEAKKYYETSISFNPTEPQVYIDYFYCLASLKQYWKAWPFYEMRYERIIELKQNIIKLKKPLLKFKKPFYEEKICILPEQGLGDTLMALRFVKAFQAIAPNSYFYSSEPLFTFAKQLGLRVKSNFDKKSSHVVGIMSLPFHLGMKEIPLPASPISHNAKKSDILRVGLCWAGSPYHPLDSQRSTYLKWYKKFIDDKNMQLFSFMKDRRIRMYANSDNKINYSEGFENSNIIDLSADMKDALSTAKLFDNIDIMVTVDTFVGHLAGSCGVPTFIIIGDKPDWRWGRHGELSEWYPTVSLVRKQAGESIQKTINRTYKKIKDGEFPPSF